MATLHINGRDRHVDADPSTPCSGRCATPRHDRHQFGCGAALCGACTVHLDGAAVRSCVTPISAAAGKKITTIEAIGSDRVGKAVQAAWVKHDVPQCGYCQSGQIMSATALLARQPASRPTPTSTRPWPATSAAAAPMRASAPPSRTPPPAARLKETTMRIDRPPRSAAVLRPVARVSDAAAALARRSFLKLGRRRRARARRLSRWRGLRAAGKADGAEADAAAVRLRAHRPDGTITVTINRLEFGQGVHDRPADGAGRGARCRLVPGARRAWHRLTTPTRTRCSACTSPAARISIAQLVHAVPRARRPRPRDADRGRGRSAGRSMPRQLRTQNGVVHRPGGRARLRRAGRGRDEAAGARRP